MTYTEVGHCRIIDLDGTDSPSAELAELCDRIAWDEEARVVLLIFGGEINGAGQTSLAEPIAKLKLPVVAAIRGDAIGPALELALACDIRIGTENARFGLPQIRDRLIPCNGGTQRLPRLVGRGKAMQMILTGELINSEEACRIGLINRVTESGSLIKMGMALAQEMAEKSPLSLCYVKEALYNGGDLTLDQGLRMELDLYLLLFTTSDRNEGIAAFREKRKPDFKGN